MLEQDTHYASLTDRALARLLDVVLISVPLTVLMLAALVYLRSLPLAILCILLEAAYKPLMEAKYGYTPGKKWRNIEVVDRSSGALMDLNQSFLRFLPWAVAYFASIFVYIRHYQSPDFAEVTSLEEYIAFTAGHVLNGNFFISLANNLTLFSSVWIFGDPLKRALHDRLAGTIVVEHVKAAPQEPIGWD